MAEPAAAFARIKDRKANLIVASLAIVALFTLTQYYESARVFGAFEANAQAGGGKTLAALNRAHLTYMLAAPAVFVGKSVAIAVAMRLGAMLALVEVPFYSLFSLAMTVQVVQVLHRATLLVVAAIRGDDPHHGLTEIGLNMWLTTSNHLVAAAAALLNPFSIWYALLLLSGAAAVANCTRRQATLMLVPYLAFVVVFAVGAAILKPTPA